MSRPILESNTATVEEMKENLIALGFEPDEVQVKGVSDRKPAEEEGKKPEEPGKLGEKPAEATGTEAAEATGAPKDKVQEPPAVETEEETAKKEKAKGGWQRQVEKKTAENERLRDKLDEEVGDKTRLKAKLEQAERELAELKAGKPAEEPKKDAGPVRPKRPELPELKAFEYDADKFEAAMKDHRKAEVKYDDEMTTYFETVAEQKAEQRVEAENKKRAAEAEENRRIEIENAFVDRRDKDKVGIPDWDEVFASIPEDANMPIADAVSAMGYIKYDSEHPALLYHFLFKDFLENNGAEGERIAALRPARQIIELKKIEDRLSAERTAKAEPPKKEEPPKAAAEKTPEKPKQQPRVPDDPIDPVGGNRVVADPNIEGLHKQIDEAGRAGDYRKVRALMDKLEEQNKKAKTAVR